LGLADLRNDLYAAIAALPELSGVAINNIWVPQYRRESMQQLEVTIAPAKVACEQRCRGSKSHTVEFLVAIIQPLDKAQGQQETQALQNMTIAESICSLLGTRIGGTTDAAITSATFDAVIAGAHWHEQNLGSTFLTLKLEY
jgi:hypothetical protein